MAKSKTVCVVDDEQDIRELLQYNLEKDGFTVETCATGEEGLKAIRKAPPDLVLLDLMLPGIDGLEVCKKLKKDNKTAHVPIVMISARGEEADVVVGLELGADDYITKPFSPRVLVARVRAVLRRQDEESPEEGTPICIRDLRIHPGRHEVMVSGQSVTLTYTEFSILNFLAQRPGWVYTREQIIDAVRGADYPVTERSVDVQIVGLRKKLGTYGQYIETVRGVGYRIQS